MQPQAIADGIQHICDIVQTSNISKRVVISSALPRVDNKDLNLKVKAANSLISFQFEGREQTTICDNYTSFVNRDGGRRDDLFEDSIHVNEQGARLLAANIKYSIAPELRPQRANRGGRKFQRRWGDRKRWN